MKGLILILSGPSGVGKDTIIDSWLLRDSTLKKVVTCTTRAPRKGEVNGIDYHFLTLEEFNRFISENAFVEYKNVYGNCYGSRYEDLEKLTEEGYNVILKIDVQGAFEVKHKIPQCVMIFIQAPSLKELKQRLIDRHSESPGQLEIRFETAQIEMAQVSEFDYLVTNDKVENAVESLQAIIKAEQLRVSRFKS